MDQVTELTQRVAEAEQNLAALVELKNSIYDRIKWLQETKRSLVFPANYEGNAKAQAKLGTATDDLTRVQQEQTTNDAAIVEAEQVLDDLRLALRDATIAQLKRERDKADIAAYEELLRLLDAQGQVIAARKHFDILTVQANAAHAKLRDYKVPSPGLSAWTGSDERIRAEAEAKLKELRARVG